jgi:HEPN domain-containing protein
MRQESVNWYKQAMEDFDTAQKIFSLKKYYASSFFCQQSAEKILKAY